MYDYRISHRCRPVKDAVRQHPFELEAYAREASLEPFSTMIASSGAYVCPANAPRHWERESPLFH